MSLGIPLQGQNSPIAYYFMALHSTIHLCGLGQLGRATVGRRPKMTDTRHPRLRKAASSRGTFSGGNLLEQISSPEGLNSQHIEPTVRMESA
jgi:hypothetical protein